MPEFLTCTTCGLLDDGLGPFGDPEVSCQCPRCPDCNEYRCVCDQSGVPDAAVA